MKPLFTQAELEDYVINECKCTSPEFDKWYNWFVRNDFTYRAGRRRYRLTNWKNHVRLQIRQGKFQVRTLEAQRTMNELTKSIGKRPYYGFPSKMHYDASRRRNLQLVRKMQNG